MAERESDVVRWSVRLRSRAAVLAWIGAVLVGFSSEGCKRDDRPTVADSRAEAGASAAVATAESASHSPTEPPGSTPAAPASAEQAGAARVADEGYVVSLQPSGEYRVGEAGEVRVVLEAIEPYKVNDEYPIRFTVQPTEGLEYAALVVGKDRARLEKQRATMPVGLTPRAAGSRRVAGKLAFSICTEDKCRFGKQDLAVVIEAK